MLNTLKSCFKMSNATETVDKNKATISDSNLLKSPSQKTRRTFSTHPKKNCQEQIYVKMQESYKDKKS